MQPVQTVLIVEDDPIVRAYAMEMFQSQGWRVMETYNAERALQLLDAHAGEIDLVFTDVRMPGEMNGLGLAQLLKRLHPGLKVILSSGYDGDAEHGFAFLPKPWSPQVLKRLLGQETPTTANRRPGRSWSWPRSAQGLAGADAQSRLTGSFR